jgi:hypothetical protein
MVTDQLNDKKTKLNQIKQFKFELDNNKLDHINNQLNMKTQENSASSLVLENRAAVRSSDEPKTKNADTRASCS